MRNQSSEQEQLEQCDYDLASYTFRRCGLAHERFESTDNGAIRVRANISSMALRILPIPVGLCSVEDRSHGGCVHDHHIQDRMSHVINTLKDLGFFSEAEGFLYLHYGISTIDSDLSRVDREMQDLLEKEVDSQGCPLHAIALRNEHAAIVDRFEALRDHLRSRIGARLYELEESKEDTFPEPPSFMLKLLKKSARLLLQLLRSVGSSTHVQ